MNSILKLLKDIFSDRSLIHCPKIIEKDGLFYKAGENIPYTGKHEKKSRKDNKTLVSGHFIDGRRNGEWLTWDIDGNLTWVLTYNNSNTEYRGTKYYKNGNKETESAAKDNKPNGECIEWYENGKKRSHGYFRNGIMIGKIECWDEDGKISYYGYYNDKGQKDGEWFYCEDDQVMRSIYKDGELIKTFAPTNAFR